MNSRPTVPQLAVARQPHGEGDPDMTSSAQFQREADAARIGLADTLGQLRDGMAPSALSAEAIALVKDSGLSILKTLAEQARANPVPALLIAAGKPVRWPTSFQGKPGRWPRMRVKALPA